MIGLIKKFFTEGHERSVKARQHIFASFFFKGISILISLAMVRLTIDYVNPTKYGIWMTLASVVGWFTLFDLGLGNGMRNKFAEAKAKGEEALAKTYISTAYAVVGLIAIGLLLIFLAVHWFLPYQSIFQTTAADAAEVTTLVLIVFSFFCVQFVVKLINSVLVADQRPAWNNAINAIASLIALGIVVTLMQLTEDGSLIYLGLAISASNLIVPLVVSIWLFRGQYKAYRPSFSAVDFKTSGTLMSLGLQFFIMAGAGLIVVATDNMIITQLGEVGEGSKEVTAYSVAWRYFNVGIMGFGMITAPFWSAFTEAWHKKDMGWIRKSTKRVTQLWFLVVIGLGVMLLLADWVYEMWLPEAKTPADEIHIPFILSALMCVWALMNTGTMIFSNFLSGVGKIRLSVVHAVVVIIINIPLSYLFAETFQMGSAGVILASCVCIFLRVLFQPIQYFKLMRGTATGIWNK